MASMAEDTISPGPAQGRWAMAIRGFFCQNVAIGCAIGGFGMTVLPTQAKFGVGRGTATLGVPLFVLAMGLTSPFVASVIARFGLRRTMIAGIILSGLGYIMLAVAPDMRIVLLAYAIPLGLGSAMFGTFASSVLAGNWFQPRPGTAIGFVNTPLFMALMPMLALVIIPRYGLSGFFLCMAGIHVLLLPLAWGIRTAPEGVAAPGAAEDGEAPGRASVVPFGTVLRRPIFWVAVIGSGALSAVGIIGVAHLPAFALERDVVPAEAALLLSLLGSASVVGAFVSGMICDRLDPARTLSLLGAGLGLSWAVMLSTTNPVAMMVAALMIGVTGGGVSPALNTFCGQLFGVASLARVLGLALLGCLPFTFGLPPLAGVLHDAVGGYVPVVYVMIAICAVAAAIFYATARIAWRRARMLFATA